MKNLANKLWITTIDNSKRLLYNLNIEMRLLILNKRNMKSAMRLLEATVWGGWDNVPPITKRKIERMEYERAKAIVNEYEFADIAQEEHKGHFQCTELDCIL